MKKYSLFLLCLGFLAACSKESTDMSAISGLKGQWAPVTADWQTDRILEFHNGTLSTLSLPEREVVRDGKVWGMAIGEPELVKQERYAIQNGRLRVGRNDLGACRVTGDTLLLGQAKFQRVKELSSAHFTRVDFGERVKNNRMIVGQKDQTVRIPCTLAARLPFDVDLTFMTPSVRIDRVRMMKAQKAGEKDSLSFHIDANTFRKDTTENLYIYHNVTGLVPLSIEQLSVDSRIDIDRITIGNQVMDVRKETDGTLVLRIPPVENFISIQYHLICPVHKSDILSVTPIPDGSMVKVALDQQDKEIITPENVRLFAFANESSRERNITITFTYTAAKTAKLKIIQEPQPSL